MEAELPGSCCQLSYKIGARPNEWPMNHECIWDTCRLTNGVNNVRVHDYFNAASASAVSFRFGGQSSMTFYTAINPSAEFEFTSGDQVITTAMLRND